MASKRYYIVLASLFFGFLMWGSVTLGDEYQISMDIPLVPRNIPEGRALKRSIPRTVAVRLKGTGWRMMSMLFSGTPECVLNVSSFGTSNVVLTKPTLLNNIVGITGLQIVDLDLDTLALGFDRYIERKVRVQPTIVVDCPDGYGVVGAMQARPESVVVGGAESVLRAKDSWKTENTVFSNVREPFTAEVRLDGSDSYAFHMPRKNVQVSVNVQPFAEKTLHSLTIETHAVPPNREIIFIPPKIDLIVRGGIERLASLSAGDFRVYVNYQQLLSDTTGFVQPSVDSLSGVRILAKRPERLQYIIRKRL